MRRVPAFVLAMAATACAAPQRVGSHSEWLKEATRVWPGETKARVIAAAEAVLRHADPADTTIDYNRHGFTARRRFLVYAVIATAAGADTWTFSAAENADGASATVRVIQRGRAQAGSQSEAFRDNQVYLGGLRLFYARIDYLLGRRPDWVTCAEAPAKLALPPEASGLQALCSLTHQGRDAPPPPRVPAKAAAPSPPTRGPPPPPELGPEERDG